ncbi:hypothetical protein EJ08DRAFT_670819 [Tothia fuscella]|uniref:Dipeptidase n=1 Tax=Tothia fuscella TaxID=1048955 RepID=A0A9P4NQR7_9PEZI|nr:hypothetical protein EJ08DRAFT_670819 [Tothia fuscella]
MILIRGRFQNHIYNSNYTKPFEKGGLAGQVDIPRITKGQYGGAFWSALMPCPRNGSDFSNEAYAPIVRATLEQLDLYHRLFIQYPKFFSPTINHASALQALKDGRLIAPAAIEGLHQIGNSLSTLRLYHQLGVRYATLTWNCHNIYADAAITSNSDGQSSASTPYWHGISPAGETLIKEMNRLGMIVDLSHVSKNTMVDVLNGTPSKNGSLAPPIFSHSSVYSICPHPRNVPDDVLHLVKKQNSLNNTLAQVVKHIVYVGELIGYDHVGIGTDYDGIESIPRGLEDVSKFPDLVAELLRQGVRERDIAKFVGRNLLRVWKDVDAVAAKLGVEMLPVEDDIPAWG